MRATARYCLFLLLLQCQDCVAFEARAEPLSIRRAFLAGLGTALLPVRPSPSLGTDINGVPADSQQQHQHQQQQQSSSFLSAGYTRREYTNSITASRDTNISPKEAYDTLQQLRPGLNKADSSTIASSLSSNTATRRALDVGAGAGVSTQLLWEMGFHEIDALDWSGEAWETNVVENGRCPPSVRFYQLDDERFLQRHRREEPSRKYDAISFNFAVNYDKALLFAKELLEPNGVLLAPVNNQRDYWNKQVYVLLNPEGKILWNANDVGAWSVQFQPDVTQETCQGIWCAPFNGFQKM